MKPPFPSPVAEWHNDTYPALDPTRPEVSARGKTIVITGGGTGIGRGMVEAFAQAGAATVVITGRRLDPLEDTKKYIESKYETRVQVFSADVTDKTSMTSVAAKVGGWDILIQNAGYLSQLGALANTDVDEWWKGYEVYPSFSRLHH